MRDISPTHPNAAAIDIGAKMHVAAVSPDRDADPVRTFGTFTGDLHRMANWFESCGVLIGNLLDGFGADHIIWGTDTPVIGPPHWQIEAFQTYTIPEELAAQYHFSRLTPEVKNKIFGENAARIFGIDIAAARQAIEGDLLYKLRDDRSPLLSGAAPL